MAFIFNLNKNSIGLASIRLFVLLDFEKQFAI